MKQNVKAVYENGVFRPVTLVFDLQEGQEVYLQVELVVKLDPAEEAKREAEFLQHMEAIGLVEKEPIPEGEEEGKDESGLESFEPLAIEGEPLSETVIKMRRGE